MSVTRSNSLFSNSIFIFLIRFFPQVATVLVMIFFSRQLDVHAYGVYQNYWVQTYLLNTIACLGIPAFILTYPADFTANLFRSIKTNKRLLYICWVVLAGSVFAALQYYRAGIDWYVPLCFLVVYCLCSITEPFLITSKRFNELVGVNVIFAIVFCFIHWQFLTGGISVERLFMRLLWLMLVKLVVYLVLLRESVKLQPVKFVSEYPYPLAVQLWKHLGFYDVSQMLFRWIDKFIVSILLAEQASAIYFNGSTDIPFLPLLLGAVGSAVLIQMANTESNDIGAVRLANQSSRILSSLVFPLFFFLLIFRAELFEVVLSDKYIPSIPVFMMSILIMPLSAYNLTVILQNRHEGAIINKGAILDLCIALALMYPLYLLLGLPGIALSFVVSSYLQAGYYLYHTSRILNVSVWKLVPLVNWALKLIVFASLFIGIHYFLSAQLTQQNALFWGIITAIIISVASLLIEIKATKRKYGHTASTQA